MPAPPEFLQGTVDVLILRTLTWEPMHGYAIARFLRDRSGGELAVEGAALYQALHRLAGRKLVRSAWGISESGRRVRVYELTKEGRAHLRQEADTWRRYADAVARILKPV